MMGSRNTSDMMGPRDTPDMMSSRNTPDMKPFCSDERKFNFIETATRLVVARHNWFMVLLLLSRYSSIITIALDIYL